jgi:p21-activated kinase 1
MNKANLADFHADPNPTAVLGTAPTAPSDDLPEVLLSPTPNLSPSFTSRSRVGSITTKGKKGMLGTMTDFLKSNKRPEISRAYDPVHLTHVGFNSSTGKFTDLPKEWQQHLQDGGISKSNQEKNPLNVMEIAKFYQEGGGDVWDKMSHAPVQGISPLPPIPGVAPAAYPGAPKSVNASAEESLNSSNANDAISSQATVAASNGTVAEHPAPWPPTAPQQRSAAVVSLAKEAGATPRRREKKKEDKEIDADIVRRLQQICTDADPTRLYRNLVKIGQG